MTRPLRYKTADDLFDHCHIHNDCYVWPESSCAIPMLGPSSPMALKFGTTSVARILFILCKYVPLGKRLVRKCKSEFCVNPYHYSESSKYMEKRAKLANPMGLFPQQEEVRHLIAPPEEELDAMRPKNPLHIKRLMDSAAIAGFDGEQIPDSNKYVPPRFRKPNYAGEAPVLTIKGFDPASLNKEPEVRKPYVVSDEDWAEIESSFKKKDSLPEIRDETEDLDDNNGEIDIFQAIKLRKEWEAKK